MDMKEIRQEIDALDDKIVEAFTARMLLCAEMAKYKKENDLPVFYPKREEEIKERITAGMPEDLAESTRAFYNALFAVSRSYQTKVINGGENGK